MRSIFQKLGHTNMRKLSTKKLIRDVDIENIRNIGILAHIDAG